VSEKFCCKKCKVEFNKDPMAPPKQHGKKCEGKPFPAVQLDSAPVPVPVPFTPLPQPLDAAVPIPSTTLPVPEPCPVAAGSGTAERSAPGTPKNFTPGPSDNSDALPRTSSPPRHRRRTISPPPRTLPMSMAERDLGRVQGATELATSSASGSGSTAAPKPI